MAQNAANAAVTTHFFVQFMPFVPIGGVSGGDGGVLLVVVPITTTFYIIYGNE